MNDKNPPRKSKIVKTDQRSKTNQVKSETKTLDLRLLRRILSSVMALILVSVALVTYILFNMKGPQPSSSSEETTSEVTSTSEDFFASYNRSNTFPSDQISSYLAPYITNATDQVIPPLTDTTIYYYKGPASPQTNFQVFAIYPSKESLDSQIGEYLLSLSENYTLDQQYSLDPFDATYLNLNQTVALDLLDFRLLEGQAILKLDIHAIHF